MKSRPPPRQSPPRKRPLTFAVIRRNAEKRLARGLKLDFDQIMSDITALISIPKKPF
jgi:urease gamma subunit